MGFAGGSQSAYPAGRNPHTLQNFRPYRAAWTWHGYESATEKALTRSSRDGSRAVKPSDLQHLETSTRIGCR